jgi:hypothetical protein
MVVIIPKWKDKMANNITLSTNVVVTLIIVWRGGMLNYSLLATFVHVHMLATSLFKSFNMAKNLFLIYIFPFGFFGCFVENFCPKKKLDAKLEIRKKNWSKTKGLKKKNQFPDLRKAHFTLENTKFSHKVFQRITKVHHKQKRMAALNLFTLLRTSIGETSQGCIMLGLSCRD